MSKEVYFQTLSHITEGLFADTRDHQGFRKRVANKKHLVSAFIRQRGRCHYCLCSMSYDERRLAPTEEHLVPRSRGGKRVGNIVASCLECNESRMNCDEQVFKFLLWMVEDKSDIRRLMLEINNSRRKEISEKSRQKGIQRARDLMRRIEEQGHFRFPEDWQRSPEKLIHGNP